MKRSISQIIPVSQINMDGIPIKQALPNSIVDHVDPFLLLHHAEFSFHRDLPAIKQGLGPHPHRGFSPVTIVIKGEVHHRDSWGNSQIARAGEVQWMHAGAGIIHSERPSQKLVEEGGVQEIIQLWINSPGASKMIPPTYQYVQRSSIPSTTSHDHKIISKIIAGEVGDQRSTIRTETDVLILWSEGKAGGSETIYFPPEYRCMLYVISGRIMVNGNAKVQGQNLILLQDDRTEMEVVLAEDSSYLFLAGSPIEEKVVQQGPFVMNTQSEILRAMRDYQMGKMGVLIEE